MEEDQQETAEAFRLLTEVEYYRLSPDERSAYTRRAIGDFGLLERFKPAPD